ncbi:hypothetical protein HGRIS_006121 [Hohenbuehelia grisea]|uniref:Large ribosomal subunit protein uL29m n=1 Tax=Hohenbuehelia grisea TaxID=104357 RepID=A0ABR3JZV7_9AGAR
MLHLLRLPKSPCSSRLPQLQQAIRHYARVSNESTTSGNADDSVLSIAPPGGLITGDFPKTSSNRGDKRPERKYSIVVKKDHGLYGFFRKKQDDSGHETYETIEAPEDNLILASGRSWTAAELRLKSFQDLHTLWYVVLRERNLLATQLEEARRLGIQNPALRISTRKARMCRKTMARIKYVMNERRLAYENAEKIVLGELEESQAKAEDEEVLRYQLEEWEKARRAPPPQAVDAEQASSGDAEAALEDGSAVVQGGRKPSDTVPSVSQVEASLGGPGGVEIQPPQPSSTDGQAKVQTKAEKKAKKAAQRAAAIEETPEGVDAAESSLFGSSSSSSSRK